MISYLFFILLDLSIAAVPPILVITLLRVVFKKLPHSLWCVLWGMVALRLILPFSVKSIFSLVPEADPVVQQIANAGDAIYASGIPFPSPVMQFVADTENLEVSIILFSLIVPFGTLGMLIWATVSALRVSMKTKEAIHLRDNIYICDHIHSSFILPGIPKPRILLPSSMEADERNYVIAHEQAHLKRLDHIWKALGFFLLTVYWWNPMVWLAYILFCRDIEFACDEKVLRNQNTAWKKSYSAALLNWSISRQSVMSSLAFGEVSVKSRIRNVLHYKKPTVWITAGALLCCAAVILCFFTSPIRTTVDDDLDAFISQAILDREESTATEGRFACESHTVLAVDKNGKETTVYLVVMYQEYSCADGVLTSERGSHYPTIITVEEQPNGYYSLEDYLWKPKYSEEDWAKFPWYVRGKLETQDYITAHSEACDRKAAEHFGITDAN